MQWVSASDLLFPLEWLLHTEHLRVLNPAADARADPFTSMQKALVVRLCVRVPVF